jgi:hypothetical protein
MSQRYHYDDAYWEWVDELPPEFKSEDSFRELQSREACEEMYEYDRCQSCESKRGCELRQELRKRRRT